MTYSPPGRAGSRMPTLCARRASASITGREVGESRSSSELKTTATVVSAQARVRASWCARSVYSSAASPPFMSYTPGPHARPCPSIRNGRCLAVPEENTVS